LETGSHRLYLWLWRSDWVLGRAVIVYQILTDVSDHLPEYATLKAMGYSDAYLIGVIIQESLLLAVWALYQGFVLDWTLRLLSPTLLPIGMKLSRATSVLIDHYHVLEQERSPCRKLSG